MTKSHIYKPYTEFNTDYEPERECNTCECTLWWELIDDRDHFYCPDCHSVFDDEPVIGRHIVEVIHNYSPKYAGLRWFGIDAVFCYELPVFSVITAGAGNIGQDLMVGNKLTDIWAD